MEILGFSFIFQTFCNTLNWNDQGSGLLFCGYVSLGISFNIYEFQFSHL